jgi:hypothetical protein
VRWLMDNYGHTPAEALAELREIGGLSASDDRRLPATPVAARARNESTDFPESLKASAGGGSGRLRERERAMKSTLIKEGRISDVHEER